jgi:hypothetical protein
VAMVRQTTAKIIMTRQFKFIIIITTVFFGLYSCDIMDNQKLTVFNDTNDTLFCFWDTDEHLYLTGNNPLNGTMNIQGKDTTWTGWNNLLLPKSQSVFSDYNWKHTITDSKTHSLYINFYLVRSFYHRDKVLKEKVRPDTTLNYSFDELEKLDWQVHLADKIPRH